MTWVENRILMSENLSDELVLKGIALPGRENSNVLMSRLFFQGEYFSDEDVRVMLAQEAAEERRRREEEYEREEAMNDEARQEEVKRQNRGILIAS